jgi:hypothetical protein
VVYVSNDQVRAFYDYVSELQDPVDRLAAPFTLSSPPPQVFPTPTDSQACGLSPDERMIIIYVEDEGGDPSVLGFPVPRADASTDVKQQRFQLYSSLADAIDVVRLPSLSRALSLGHWGDSEEKVASRLLGISDGRSRGRFATPADYPLHDGSPSREPHVRRGNLGVVLVRSILSPRAYHTSALSRTLTCVPCGLCVVQHGKGNRQEYPDHVIQAVRNLYPDPDGVYTGFRDAAFGPGI